MNELLFSSVEGVLVESVEVIDTVVRLEARTTAGRAACPGCGCWSGRIHGSYLRLPRDLPTAGKFVVVSLRVRSFVCEEESCERMTFAEQVPGLTRPRPTVGSVFPSAAFACSSGGSGGMTSGGSR
ncbi:transposase family protein [Streptomyces sp. NPDC055140]